MAAHSLLKNFGRPEKILSRTESAEPCVAYTACIQFSMILLPPLPLGNDGGQKNFSTIILALGRGQEHFRKFSLTSQTFQHFPVKRSFLEHCIVGKFLEISWSHQSRKVKCEEKAIKDKQEGVAALLCLSWSVPIQRTPP